MQRILMSVGLMAFAGAVAISSTGAFFSDTETSTGNTFTAGALDLTVDDTQHYAGLVCQLVGPNYVWVDDNPTSTTRPELIGQPCTGTWILTDLGPSHQFFNFSDVKPGDPGENTISLHIDNSAWACLDIGTNGNAENDLIDPEVEAGDITPGPLTGGELAEFVTVFGWLDQGVTGGFQGQGDTGEGDNIHQQGEPTLFAPKTLSGFNATTTLTLADGGTGTPLPGGSTSYVGLAWCVGSTTVDGGTGAISCNGSGVGNQVQTDSATSTVMFRVEQSRNNSNFRCIPQPQPQQP